MKKRILLIDDEPEFTEMLKLRLEAEGYYEVGQQNEASGVLGAIRDFDPDLILLDVMMPSADGSEIAARIKSDRILRGIPVIFLTALIAGEEAPTGSCNSGGQTFLPKDIPIEKLIECIEAKLTRHAEPVPAQ